MKDSAIAVKLQFSDHTAFIEYSIASNCWGFPLFKVVYLHMNVLSYGDRCRIKKQHTSYKNIENVDFRVLLR